LEGNSCATCYCQASYRKRGGAREQVFLISNQADVALPSLVGHFTMLIADGFLVSVALRGTEQDK
jgi:hypothetical protein